MTSNKSNLSFEEASKPVDGLAPAAIQSYCTNLSAHRKGISQQESCKLYDQWAETYDQDFPDGIFNGPRAVTNAIADYFPEDVRAKTPILDVAAGTGRVGIELDKKGFRLIDGLEPSAGMVKLLEDKKLYRKTFLLPIGNEIIAEIDTNTYDCLVISGGMGEGHIPMNAIAEMIRVVKPGGTIFIMMREEYLDYVEDYAGKLEPYMAELESNGFWKRVSRTPIENYAFKKTGILFIYTVTSDVATL